MQVKKVQHTKINRQIKTNPNPTYKNPVNKTNFKSKDKHYNQSTNQKQNIKHRTLSKSKEKVSPIKIKKKQILTTSPIFQNSSSPVLHNTSIYKKNKKSYECQYGKKIIHSHRDYETKCQTVSTKLNTQRTPPKKFQLDEPIKTKSSTERKNKKCKKPIKNKMDNKNICQTEKLKIEIMNDEQNNSSSKRKFKKVVPQIKTTGPHRKQSYFDEQIIQKLYFNKPNHIPKTYQSALKFNKNIPQFCHASTQINPIKCISKQYGSLTEDNIQNPPVNKRDLQSFKKQQQLKWKIIYLELNDLKNCQTPQKIQNIIQQSNKNITEFQSLSKSIISSQVKTDYVFESPTKVKEALRRNRKSQEQIKLIVKNFSDKKLLHELEIMENFQEINNLKSFHEEKPSNSFCMELEKQLEHYCQENFLENQNIEANHHFPQLEFDKSKQILQQIQHELFIQLCHEIVQNEILFHSFLSISQKLSKDQQEYIKNHQQDYIKIKSESLYSIDLSYSLFKHIQKSTPFSRDVIKNINIPFGNQPQVNLKWLRNYFSQSSNLQDDGQITQPVISRDILTEFQSMLTSDPVQDQYLFNQCVYSCLNQILDTLRPYGTIGPPPLQRVSKSKYVSVTNIFNDALEKLKQILDVGVQRNKYEEYENNPIQIATKSYKMMSKMMVLDEEEKFKRIEDYIFEETYFLAESVGEQIFNDQLLMILNSFM